MSAQLTDQTFRRAQAVYRLRTLSETYGINLTNGWPRLLQQGPKLLSPRMNP